MSSTRARSDRTRPPVRMLLHSAFDHDTRVLREATALVEAGYRVEIVAGQDPLSSNPLPASEVVEGVEVERIESESRTATLGRSVAAAVRARRRPAGRDAADSSPATGATGAAPSPVAAGGLASRAYWAATRAVKSLDYLRWARAAVRRVSAGGPAIFVAHDLVALPVGWWARRRAGGALVYDAHELYSERDTGALGSGLARRRWQLVELALIRAADRVMTVNDSIADELARRYRAPRPTVIRNVPRHPSAAARALDLRSHLEIPPDLRIVLYLGIVTRNRGLEQVVASLGEVPGCAFVMLGRAPVPEYVTGLRKLVASEGVADRVHLLDPVPPDSVIPTARSADVGVTFIQNVGLNNYLSLPNKLFEYVHAGLPVVASAFPELERVVAGRGIGLTCDPTDPAAIGASLRAVLGDDAGRARMSANALAAAGELSWDAERERYTALFDGLAVRDR